MSRQIQSPVKKFPGYVVLPDALSWPQYLAWSDAVLGHRDDNANERTYAIIGGVIACVEEWHIQGIAEHPTKETFPATPPTSVSRLISWLMDEINAMLEEADEAPNA